MILKQKKEGAILGWSQLVSENPRICNSGLDFPYSLVVAITPPDAVSKNLAPVSLNLKPYDPRIHFVLIRDAYLDANPGNEKLKTWLDDALNKFDNIYTADRPGFIDGYKKLKDAIKPWA